MASLYIKDSETAALASDLATRLKLTKTEIVRDALKAKAAQLADAEPPRTIDDIHARLATWRRAHPLPPPTGLKADKAFFDKMWGEV